MRIYLLAVGAGLFLLACWWSVLFPPPMRTPRHCWRIQSANADRFRTCGDHIIITSDPVLAGYSIVEVRDTDERVTSSYRWVYNVKEIK